MAPLGKNVEALKHGALGNVRQPEGRFGKSRR